MAITQIPVRTLPDIFYEDPEPVEDHMLQEEPLTPILNLLHKRYADRPDVFVSGGGFVMYNQENGNERVAPDCYIAFDVDAAGIRENMPNFLVWRVGKVPDFVMEMASPSTAANDMGRKRDLYARLGIPEYWRLDHTGGDLYGQPLIGERLIDRVYVPYEVRTEADGSVTSYSAVLDLIFSWNEVGGFDLLDPVTKRTIDPIVTERAARLVAEARADTAAAYAGEERVARLAAEARSGEEQEARLAEQARANAAESEARALREELGRLRRQQPDQ